MRQFLPARSSERWIFCGLLALTFLSASAIVAYHAHTGTAVVGGIAYMVAFSSFAMWLLSGSQAAALKRTISSPVFWCLILLLMATVDERHYLKARQSPAFASSAEALERPARLLSHGEEPYRYLIGGIPAGPNVPTTDAETPISPGPGWVVLLSPLTVPAATGLVASVFVAFALLVFAKRSKLIAGVFLLLLLAQPIFFFQAENGQDLYVISIAFVIVALLADGSLKTNWNAILLGLLSGFVATARVPMLLPLAVIGFGCFRRNRRTGSVFLAVSMLTALALHVAFAIWAHRYGHFYQPMHVFHRASTGAGSVSRIAAILLLCLSLLWVLRRMRDEAASWCVGAFLVMASLFIPEALKELAYARALNWEGSTYITFMVPLLIAALALRAAPRETRSSSQTLNASMSADTAS